VDFTTAQQAGPAAALYIAAEMDRARVITGRKLSFLDASDWHPLVLDFMYQLGLFGLLELVDAPKHSQFGSVVVRKMERHVGIDATAAEAFRDALADMIGKRLPKHLATYEAIMEAVTNVKYHAYSKPNRDQSRVVQDSWWITASYEQSKKLLQIVFLDQGVGIPETLPKTAMEILKSIIARNGDTDSSRIEAALVYGRSSTGELGRGKGFGDMMALVDAVPSNYLRVLSGRGECVYQGGNLVSREYIRPISGTLVQWTLVID
jgi:anti-sigma regulatory factor (Ser/Thr protein kinase)